ncbi:MAG TPA: ComEC/Rec2 family competence protein [Devosia sp.]|nr:ComEC/Rec2 family competence protein [Devosia sp.]
MKAAADAAGARRVFLLAPFAMILGLTTYAGLPGEPSGWALLFCALPLGALFLLRLRHRTLTLVGLLGAFYVGLCLLPLHGHWLGTAMLMRPVYGLYEARVDEVLSATEQARRVVVSGLAPAPGERTLEIRRARLLVPSSPAVAPGDRIRASLRLAPVAGPVLPGTHDGQFHAYFDGVGAYGTVTSNFELVSSGGASDPTRMIDAIRMAIGSRIDAILDDASAAIGRAMVVGDQSAIADDTRDVMAASGLAHIYSISGLHLSIVAGGIYWLLRLLMAATPSLPTALPTKKLAALGGLVAAFGYLLLAGGVGNVPAFRSTLMLALVFGAVLAGRRALTMRNVAFAALVIIAIDPASVFRASFQLSFAAVVALIGAYEMPRRNPEKEAGWFNRLWSPVWAAAMTSFIAGTATLVFSAYHFQQTAPLGVIGNVLVLPLVSLVIMPFAVLSVIMMPLGLEEPFVSIMGWGIDRMVDCAALVAGWSNGLTGNPLLTSSALLSSLGALAWFAYFQNWWRLIGPALAVPLILLFALDSRPDILIADSTQSVAVRVATGLKLATGRTGSFAVDAWSEHFQEEIAASADGTTCDSLGCIVRTPRFTVAVVKNVAALPDDCGAHDLLIARIPVPATCTGGQVIDADDLARGGVHWLRWQDGAGQFEIRPAISNLNRPWRVAPP